MNKIFLKGLTIFYSTLFLVFILSSCSFMEEFFFGKNYGPYHHGAYITIFANTVEVDGKRYATGGTVYRLENQSFTQIPNPNNTEEGHLRTRCDFQTDGRDLYVASRDKKGISVFSSDFEYQSSLGLPYAETLLLDGQKIYYQAFDAPSEEENGFFVYDKETGDTARICDQLKNEYITLEGKSFYADLNGYLYYANETEGVNLNRANNDGIETGRQLGFYYDQKTGLLSISEQGIKVSYGGEVHFYATETADALYSRILVHEGKLLFATMEQKESADCLMENCICHVEQSNVFSYNFSTKEFEYLKTLQDEEYLISYDLSYCTYYSNGKVFRNDVIVSTVDKIEPDGSFIQKGTASKGIETARSESVFFDNGNELYYQFNDFSAYLKDEYF